MSSRKPTSLGLTPNPFCFKSQGQRKFPMAHVPLWGLLSPRSSSGAAWPSPELVLPSLTCARAFGELDSALAAPPSPQSGSPAPHATLLSQKQSPRKKQRFHQGRWSPVTTGSLAALSWGLSSEHLPFSLQRVFLCCLQSHVWPALVVPRLPGSQNPLGRCSTWSLPGST